MSSSLDEASDLKVRKLWKEKSELIKLRLYVFCSDFVRVIKMAGLADAVKNTQNTLGKIVTRPPLTEKLLKKPPFRFLHDVISAVIKETGALKGLYTAAEMKSDNV